MTSSFGSAIAIEDDVTTEYLPQLFFMLCKILICCSTGFFISGVDIMNFGV